MASPKDLLLGKRKARTVAQSSGQPVASPHPDDGGEPHADSPVSHYYGVAGAVNSDQDAEIQRICRYFMTGQWQSN